MSDVDAGADAGRGAASRRGPGVALDVQVLQVTGRPKAQWPGWPGWPPGSTPLAHIQDHVRAYAAALHRAGRLAGAMMAPELPAPGPDDPAGEVRAALRWDSRAEVRRLVAGGGPMVHHVAAPFLDTDYRDPAGRVVSGDWAEAGVPTVVTLFDLDPLEDPGGWLGSPARRTRYLARVDWVARAELIVATTGRVADQVVDLVGYPRERVLVVDGDGPARPDRVYDRLVEDLIGALPEARSPGGRFRGAPASPPVGRLRRRVALVGPFPPAGGGIGAYNADVLAALASSPTNGGDQGGGRAGALHLDAVDTAPGGWGSPGWRPPAGVGLIHPDSLGTDIRPASYDQLVYTIGNSSGHLTTVESALRHPGWLWLHETRLPALATTALDGLADSEFRARMEWLLERAYPGRAPIAALGTAGRSHLALADAGVGLTAPLVGRSAGVLVNSSAARQFLLLDLPPLAWHPPIHVLPPGCPPLRPAPDRDGPARSRPLAVAFGVVSMSKRPDLLVDAAAAAGCELAFVGPCPPVLAELVGDRAGHLGIADRVRITGAVSDEEWWAWMARATVAVQLREQSSGEISAAVLDALSAGTPVVTNLPSAGDYPDATVALLPGGPGAPPDPLDLADLLERLCSDPERLDGLGHAGRDYAARHQMGDLARALLRAVTTG